MGEDRDGEIYLDFFPLGRAEEGDRRQVMANPV